MSNYVILLWKEKGDLFKKQTQNTINSFHRITSVRGTT